MRIVAGLAHGAGKSATLVALITSSWKMCRRHVYDCSPLPRAATRPTAKKVAEHPAAAAERPSTIHSFSISVPSAKSWNWRLPRTAEDC